MKKILVALMHNIKLNEVNWQTKFIANQIQTAFMLKEDHCFEDSVEIKNFLIKESITEVEILNTEIQSVLDVLIQTKKIEPNRFDNSLIMREEEINRLEDDTNKWLKLEEDVKKEWIDYIGSKYQITDTAEPNFMWQQLAEQFLPRVLLKHGAETTRIIYKSEELPGTIFPLTSILEESIKPLPERLQQIAQIEFPLFFNPSLDNRRKYLTGILSCAFDQYSIAIPKDCLADIYSTTNFVLTLFLDTNFIFSLLELHEHHLNEAVRELWIALNKISAMTKGRITIKLRYTPDTEHEFIKVLEGYTEYFGHSVPSKSVAKAAIKSKQIQTLHITYFRKIVESNLQITMNEFLSPFIKGLRHILKEKGIEIYQDNEFDRIRNTQEVIDDIHNQEEYFKKSEKERTWDSIQHDVRLWHYINVLRKGIPSNASFFQKKYFILTCDYSFLGFDRHKHRNESDDIYCLLPTQFMQILGFLVPRTDDFEKAFLHSLRMPVAKPFDETVEKVSLNIIKAMSVYNDFPEQVALEILRDDSVREHVKHVKDPEEIRTIIEQTISLELEEERRKHKEDITRMDAEKERALVEKDTKLKEMEIISKNRDERIRELENTIAAIKTSGSKIETQKEETKAEKKESINLSKIKVITNVLVALFVCILIYLVFNAYVPILNTLGKILISLTLFIIIIYFRFKTHISLVAKTILQWVLIGGTIISAIKNTLDILTKLSKK
jgi:hypothetical protein